MVFPYSTVFKSMEEDEDPFIIEKISSLSSLNFFKLIFEKTMLKSLNILRFTFSKIYNVNTQK